MINFDEEKQNARLEEFHQKEEEELAKILSNKYGVSYIDLSNASIKTDALKLVPEAEARQNKLAVFDILDKKISVAVVSPHNPHTQESLEKLKKDGYLANIFMVSELGIEKAWERYKDISFSVKSEEGMLSISDETITNVIKNTKTISEIKNFLDDIQKNEQVNKVSRFFDIVLAGALSLNASDIHIEPEEDLCQIRYRLDGLLTNITSFETKNYNLLLSRIKLIAGLKLNIKNNSQDGRFSIKINSSEIEIRASTMPGSYGESIVLRILNPDSISVSVEDLGIDSELLERLKKEMEKPNGMILNTGPTGSGKTTTLYAFLHKIQSPDIKIITIEDPVEYHLNGITQTQVNQSKGYTFAQGLRSALRQDPDVIMVGEIRDQETAEIAINSALTGHLVLSTLHTNTAAGTFPRLIDLGVNSKIIGSAINATMAQRLVRKICQFCKKEDAPNDREKEIIQNNTADLPEKYKKNLTNLNKIYRPVGCEKCNGIGYKGRIGVFEVIFLDENIENIIKENPSEREIEKISKKQENLNMREDGILKVLKGITTIDELERVIVMEKK